MSTDTISGGSSDVLTSSSSTSSVPRGGYEVVNEGGPLTTGFLFFEMLMGVVFLLSHVSIRAKRKGLRNRYERLDNMLGARAEIGLEALGGLALGLGLGGASVSNVHVGGGGGGYLSSSPSPAGQSTPTNMNNAMNGGMMMSNGSFGGMSPGIGGNGGGGNAAGGGGSQSTNAGMGFRRTASGIVNTIIGGIRGDSNSNNAATTAASSHVAGAGGTTAVNIPTNRGGYGHSRSPSFNS